jgi:hypothetical protein
MTVVLGQSNQISYDEGIDDLMKKTGIDLPTAQMQMGGFTELELVSSVNGVSVRYASGRHNFDLYRKGTGRGKEDAGLSDALEACEAFVKDSSTRWVSTYYGGVDGDIKEALTKLVESGKRIMGITKKG